MVSQWIAFSEAGRASELIGFPLGPPAGDFFLLYFDLRNSVTSHRHGEIVEQLLREKKKNGRQDPARGRRPSHC